MYALCPKSSRLEYVSVVQVMQTSSMTHMDHSARSCTEPWRHHLKCLGCRLEYLSLLRVLIGLSASSAHPS